MMDAVKALEEETVVNFGKGCTVMDMGTALEESMVDFGKGWLQP